MMVDLRSDRPETGADRDHSGRRVTDVVGVPFPRAPAEDSYSRQALAFLLPAVDAVALSLAAAMHGWLGMVYAAAVLMALAAVGQHRLRICRRVSDQIPRMMLAVALPLMMVLAGMPSDSAVLMGVSAAAALITARGATYIALRALHRRGRLLEPTLIVGTDEQATQIARMLAEHPEFGLLPTGFLDRCLPGSHMSLPLLGDLRDLVAVITRHRISRVIVCSPATDESELVSLVRSCRSLAADVCLVPRLSELGMAIPRGCLDEVWGVPLVPLRQFGYARARVLVKRAFDMIGGCVLLVALAPMVFALAIGVRISLGSSFFRQIRITGPGKVAEVVKLRTVIDSPYERWTVPPQRCTRLGRWLRATHFDELPQLLNVLRGEMSLVGPRPERPCYATRFAQAIPRYDDRHRMPGGVTGWAQVHGLHGDTSITDRARFDNHYIEYWSLWMDIVIAARTVAIVLRTVWCGTPAARSPRADELVVTWHIPTGEEH
jgi:exopolysaccharide biosynthesis polyprenyl glycosylphosphotransferase